MSGSGPVSEIASRGATSAPPGVGLSESPWSLSWSGVRTVYLLELRQRVRSRWWAVMVGIWFLLLAALTLLIYVSISGSGLVSSDRDGAAGATMFGVVAILVLSLAALVSPALSATSINGDRAHGVLAALQSTLLTPAELVIGKLLAAWTSALTLIAAALPFFAWAVLLGGTTLARLISTLVLICLSLLVVCAIGLGSSSLVARTSASAAQTYLLVVGLGLGLPLLFVLTLPMVRSTEQVMEPGYLNSVADPNGEPTCRLEAVSRTVTHTEYTWWLLAATPYVVVADYAPAKKGLAGDDPLAGIRDGVRSLRLGTAELPDRCPSPSDAAGTVDDARQAQLDDQGAVWPYGLAIDLAIGGLFTVAAIRRLRTPAGKLPRDTRVA